MHGSLGFFASSASARDSFTPDVPLHLEVTSVRSDAVEYLLLGPAKLGLDVEDLLMIDAPHTLIYLIRCRLKRSKRIVYVSTTWLVLTRCLKMLMLMAVNWQLDALSHLLKPLTSSISRPTVGSPITHGKLYHIPFDGLLMALMRSKPASRACIPGA